MVKNRNKRGGTIPLVLAVLTLSGCVSQKDYDAILEERDQLQAQVEEMTGMVSDLEENVAALQDYAHGLQEMLEVSEETIDRQQAKIEELTGIVDEIGSMIVEEEKATGNTQTSRMIQSFLNSAVEAKDNFAESVTDMWNNLKDQFSKQD